MMSKLAYDYDAYTAALEADPHWNELRQRMTEADEEVSQARDQLDPELLRKSTDVFATGIGAGALAGGIGGAGGLGALQYVGAKAKGNGPIKRGIKTGLAGLGGGIGGLFAGSLAGAFGAAPFSAYYDRKQNPELMAHYQEKKDALRDIESELYDYEIQKEEDMYNQQDKEAFTMIMDQLEKTANDALHNLMVARNDADSAARLAHRVRGTLVNEHRKDVHSGSKTGLLTGLLGGAAGGGLLGNRFLGRQAIGVGATAGGVLGGLAGMPVGANIANRRFKKDHADMIAKAEELGQYANQKETEFQHALHNFRVTE